jgi:ferredoxin-NADP reductase
MVEPSSLGFVGGQFIIIDTGMVRPSGLLAKRAYTMISSDTDQTRFELVARRMDDGMCSNYLHQMQLGSTLTFSGPWGKFLPAATSSSAATWVVATDTGVTAALGLLRSTAFCEQLSRTTFLWLSPSVDDFVSESFIRERVFGAKRKNDLSQMRVASLPPVHHPERVHAALAHFHALPWSAAPQRVYLAGDGALLYPLASAIGQGFPDAQVAIESFFNVPVKKVDIEGEKDKK